MGFDRFSDADWTAHSTSVASKPAAAIFTSSNLPDDLNPAKFKLRESRDSAANPLSTPIAIFVDVSGSMGKLADVIVRTGLGTVVNELYARKPVTDPHVLLGAIGDAEAGDSSPIQATQFESGATPLIEQLTRLHIEHGGGGNECESYLLPLLFMARKTACDSQIKRGHKGYIFTFGDENPHPRISSAIAKRFLDLDIESDLTAKELLDLVRPNWHYFHGVIADDTSKSYHSLSRWRTFIGQRAIDVQDHSKLAEIIVSTIQVVEGASVDSVVASWDGSTSLAVSHAVKGLSGLAATDKSRPGLAIL